MSVIEIEKTQPGSAAELREQVREQLGQLDRGLRVVAEDVMGVASPIDLLALDSRGGAVALVIARNRDEEAALLTRSLAHRAWLATRLRDWAKLAPELGAAEDEPVRAILLAPEFGEETRAAARALGAGIVELVRYVPLRVGGRAGLLLEPLDEATALDRGCRDDRASTAPPESSDPLPAFRSNLSESDLGRERPARIVVGE